MVFVGKYDVGGKEQLRADLDRLAGLPAVVLDLSSVTYIDSMVITELMRLHNLRAERRLEPETIIVGGGHLNRLFDLLQLDKVFRLVDSANDLVWDRESELVHYAFSHEDDDDASEAAVRAI
jgi:anti-anti-sigma regulatory factor